MSTPTTISQIEGVVTGPRDVPLFQIAGQNGDAPLNELGRMVEFVGQEPLWQRLEQWVAHRWHERTVVWIVEGYGEWTPPLTPVTEVTAERWEGNAWEAATLDAAPMGHSLPIAARYRFTAVVGRDNPVPHDVVEAMRRLVFYCAQLCDDPGGTTTAGEVERPVAWPARAMQLSGAADLLRKYRSVY